MEEAGIAPARLDELEAQAAGDVDAAVEAALASPKPEPGAERRERLRAGRMAHAGTALVTASPDVDVRELTIAQALNEALREEMERDPGCS